MVTCMTDGRVTFQRTMLGDRLYSSGNDGCLIIHTSSLLFLLRHSGIEAYRYLRHPRGSMPSPGYVADRSAGELLLHSRLQDE
jgi:hypothetical protein